MQEAVKPPSFEVAVMTAVPAPFPVTVPSFETWATDGSEDDQVHVLSEASSGSTVAVSVNSLPRSIVFSVQSIVIPVARLTTFTGTVIFFGVFPVGILIRRSTDP